MITYPTVTVPKSPSRTRGDAGGEDQHAGDLHERGQPVRDVVGVVRRGEPGEVHPRPPDGEEHRQVRDEPVQHVTLGDRVVQQLRRPARWRPRNTGRTAAPAASRPGAARRVSRVRIGRRHWELDAIARLSRKRPVDNVSTDGATLGRPNRHCAEGLASVCDSTRKNRLYARTRHIFARADSRPRRRRHGRRAAQLQPRQPCGPRRGVPPSSVRPPPPPAVPLAFSPTSRVPRSGSVGSPTDRTSGAPVTRPSSPATTSSAPPTGCRAPTRSCRRK